MKEAILYLENFIKNEELKKTKYGYPVRRFWLKILKIIQRLKNEN